ncbi:MAG: hypothetical protein ACO1TE_17350 [Prosthecobacter sp.]
MRLPGHWMTHPDVIQREAWWKQFTELKEHLWQEHLASLSEDEQREFREGSHPSQSHQHHDRAQPFCELLQKELHAQGAEAMVKLGLYHLNRLVLNVRFNKIPPEGLPGSPWLFRGFEVMVVLPQQNPQAVQKVN